MKFNYEKLRSIDQDMTNIIQSKCAGQVADFLIELWRKNVSRNEEISHKRWQNNERWLKSYEDDFLENYRNSNPFFKTGNSNRGSARINRTYADAVRQGPSVQRNFRRNQRNNENINSLLQQIVSKLNYKHYKSNDNNQHRQRNQYYTQQRNNQGRRQIQNRSNNSQQLTDGGVVTQDNIHSFLEADHNWRSQM